MFSDRLGVLCERTAAHQLRTTAIDEYFSQGPLGMGNKHMKRCSTTLALWETAMRFKSTMRFHFTLIRMARFKKQVTIKGIETVEKPELIQH